MKNKAWWIVSACVLVLLVGGGLTWWLVRTTKGPSRVGYNAVSSPISETLLLTGRVAQPAQTELGSMVQNTVVEVLVDEGDAVEAGTLLLRLADEEAAARVREADAAVAEAEARLGRVRGVGRRVAGERLRQAKLESDEAIKDFERSQRLFDEGALTEAALDQARQRRDTAKSQSIAATLEAAATGQTGADTAAAAASLARAQAALESAQIGLDRTRIRAPTAGIVLQRLVAAGQVVRPGDPLVRFSGGGALEVRITPDETHLGRLTLGLTAKVVFEAFPRRTLDAKVSHIAPLVDPERGTVEVRLALDTIPTDLSLRPDMTATVEVLLGQADTA
ncbi:MAG: efflux RND transporter periplasmic adaptor subunit, partial [Myxococcota bacterium]